MARKMDYDEMKETQSCFTPRPELGESIVIRLMERTPVVYDIHSVRTRSARSGYATVNCTETPSCRSILLDEMNAVSALHDLPVKARYRTRIWNHTTNRAEIFTGTINEFGRRGFRGIDDDPDWPAITDVDLKIECIPTSNPAFPSELKVVPLPKSREITTEMREAASNLDLEGLTDRQQSEESVRERCRALGILASSSLVKGPASSNEQDHRPPPGAHLPTLPTRKENSGGGEQGRRASPVGDRADMLFDSLVEDEDEEDTG